MLVEFLNNNPKVKWFNVAVVDGFYQPSILVIATVAGCGNKVIRDLYKLFEENENTFHGEWKVTEFCNYVIAGRSQ